MKVAFLLRLLVSMGVIWVFGAVINYVATTYFAPPGHIWYRRFGWSPDATFLTALCAYFGFISASCWTALKDN